MCNFNSDFRDQKPKICKIHPKVLKKQHLCCPVFLLLCYSSTTLRSAIKSHDSCKQSVYIQLLPTDPHRGPAPGPRWDLSPYLHAHPEPGYATGLPVLFSQKFFLALYACSIAFYPPIRILACSVHGATSVIFSFFVNLASQLPKRIKN